MTEAILEQIKRYVNEHIVAEFHAQRLDKVQELKLEEVLKSKNPYLFRAKNLLSAPELVASILDAYLSSSEEASFGTFLEGLAVHVAHLAYGGQKSSSAGLDLDFTRDGVRYLVSVKSGPNWGNSSSWADLKESFANAVAVLKQGAKYPIQPVVGICYSKVRKVDNGHYLKVNGQDFWELISGDPNLYTELIEPIGFESKKHDDFYQEERAKLYNRFTLSFINEFCHESGQIDWNKLIKFNSQTIDRASLRRKGIKE
jgi:Type II restriction endonuclease EcoO109I